MNVEKIEDRMMLMKPQELQQFAAMHKNDPYILPLAMRISDMRKKMQIAQGMQYAGQKPPTVVEQMLNGMSAPPESNAQSVLLPEDQGIGTLPAQNIERMADGGIAGYSDGGVPGYQQGGKTFDPDQYITNPNVQKFLAYINIYEGSPKPNQLVGYKPFDSLADHPRKLVRFGKNKNQVSTAAGLYQFKSSTWDEQKKKLGLKDFSVENQQRAAIGLLKDVGALDAIVKGDFEAAKQKAKNRWTSLPGSTLGKETGQKPRINPQAEAYLKDRPETATTTAPAPVKAAPAPVKAAPAADETIYSPDGIPLTSAPGPSPSLSKNITQGAKDFGSSTASTLDTLYNLLPGTAATLTYPFARLGMSSEAAKKKVYGAAQDLSNPIGRAFGITQDPEYTQAPAAQAMEFISNNLGRTAKWISDKTGIPVADVENMQETILLGAPGAVKAVKNIKPVEYNFPSKVVSEAAPPPAKVTTAAKPAPDALNPTGAPVDAGLPALTARAAVKADPKLLNPAEAAPTAGLPGITPRAPVVEAARVAEPVRTPAQLEAARQSALALNQAKEMQAANAARDRAAAEQQNQPAPKTRVAKAEAEAKAAERNAQLAEANKAVEARRAKEAAETARRNAEADAQKAGVVKEAAVPDGAPVRGAPVRNASVAPYIRTSELLPAATAAASNVADNAAEAAMEESVTPEAVDYTGLGLAGSDSGNKKQRETFDAKVEDPAAEAPAAKAPAAKDPAAGAVTTEAKKTGLAGLTDEDYLTLGLNMLAGAGPRRGSPLQDLMSGLGTAGIATLGARKEREKLAMEKAKEERSSAYQDTLGKYHERLTGTLGETPEMRNSKFFQENPEAYGAYLERKAMESAATEIPRLVAERARANSLMDSATVAVIDEEIARLRAIQKKYKMYTPETNVGAAGEYTPSSKVAEALKLYP
jgi:muramidase (phage lysozyme)